MKPMQLASAAFAAEEVAHKVRTRYGIEFDARSDWWPIDGRQGIPVAPLRALFAGSLKEGFELTFRDCARKYSWATLHQFAWSVRHFQRSICAGMPIVEFKLADLRKYRTLLMKEFGHEDYLRQIRSLLTNWVAARHTGVDAEVVEALKAMKLKGAETGRAVRVMDPEKGPLSPGELSELVQCLYDAAEAGTLDVGSFSLAYLHIATGRRPVQTSQLKCKDVVQRAGDAEPGFPEGRPLFLLAIPRGKQRGHVFRETRRAVDLTGENFLLFQAQRDAVRSEFLQRLTSAGVQLDADLQQFLLDELALYPSWDAVQQAIQAAADGLESGKTHQVFRGLQEDAKGSAWHQTPKALSLRVAAICESVGARSRSGGALKVTAARLRHTKGTDLAREGLPTTVIAWLLDHSTSRSADIYVDNLPEHAAEINRALSKSSTMQMFAAAFRGTLVDSEQAAVGGHDPSHSRLTYGGKGAATCGHLKQCGLDGGIPHACYTCRHFQPWLDGPHEEFLGELLAERADLVTQLGENSPIAKRRDRLIAAVGDVIELCKARRAELEAAPSDGKELE